MTREGKAENFLKNLVENQMNDFRELRDFAPNPIVKGYYELKLQTLESAMQRIKCDVSNTRIIETFQECIQEYRDEINLGMSRKILEHYEDRIETLQSILDRFIGFLMQTAEDEE